MYRDTDIERYRKREIQTQRYVQTQEDTNTGLQTQRYTDTGKLQTKKVQYRKIEIEILEIKTQGDTKIRYEDIERHRCRRETHRDKDYGKLGYRIHNKYASRKTTGN